MNRFEAAPWPTALKVVSLLATAVLAGVSYAMFRAIPTGTRVPYAQEFGTVMAFVCPVIALIALLFIVRSYEIDPDELGIERLFWTTRISLAGLTRAWHDPAAMKRSIRVFGNGGLYSITGLYRNRTLGTYRAFVTDPKRSVILALPKRVVVISPADPRAFLQLLAARCPGVRIDGAGGAA
jgi:PH (Pleckstrin Homology) domain-containing protein